MIDRDFDQYQQDFQTLLVQLDPEERHRLAELAVAALEGVEGGSERTVLVKQGQLAALIGDRRRFHADLIEVAVRLGEFGSILGDDVGMGTLIVKLPSILKKAQQNGLSETIARVVREYHPDIRING